MSLLNFPTYDCANESDVEQKFLYPLLTHPSFLDIPAKAVLAKRSMGSLSFVEKSTLPKNYIPDYIVFFSGFPTCVFEAKKPEESIDRAIDEARLYAQVLNANFPSGTNPVLMVVGCNGRELAVGPWDSNDTTKFATSDLVVGSKCLSDLRNLVGTAKLSSHGTRIQRKMQRHTFVPPARFMDQGLFLARIMPNALAPYLNQIYEMFFRAEDPEKIQLILDRAYVDTAELREYDEVLHAMLRQIERTHSDLYQTIQTDRRREYTLTPELTRYESDIGAHGRMHLIIGSRGAGKSLFIARFFTHLISPALRERAVWCVLDFNRAPSSIGSVEDYVCDKFVENAENIGFDPYDIEGLSRVLALDLNRLRKGPAAVMGDEQERERFVAGEMLRLSSDRRHFAVRLGQHLTGEAARPLIIAFDNVDRRESSQQLQIFQAAQWFRSETRAFALLTLRDVTFERFKREPPLDAFAQMNNFYIRPPRFSLVLQKRLTLAIEEGLKDLQEIEQTTSTGLRFVYTTDHLGIFLRRVYSALFAGDQQVGRIVDNLAERDVRDALGMFARILASGHFNPDRIIGIGIGGSRKVSHDLLLKILMRSDYRLYSEKSGFIRNLFWAPSKGFTGNVFLRAELLGFLAQELRSGIDNIAGFWRVEEMVSDLTSMGFEEQEVVDAAQAALESKLIAYEGEETAQLTDTDLVKLTPSGFIHLRSLPRFVEYISSVAMHSALGDAAVARRISEVWSRASRTTDLSFADKHDVASIFADYMVREKSRLDLQNPLFRERCREAEGLVKILTHTVNLSQAAADKFRAQKEARLRAKRMANKQAS